MVAAPISAQPCVRLTLEIVAGMQQLALEQQRLLGPRAPWHVGDVAWGLRQHEGRDRNGRSGSGATVAIASSPGRG
jgi:hypothetical protein